MALKPSGWWSAASTLPVYGSHLLNIIVHKEVVGGNVSCGSGVGASDSRLQTISDRW